MSFNAGNITATLADAVGNDDGLAEDLKQAFIDSAGRHLDMMTRARCDANWQISAWRLKGLSATFGMAQLIDLAEVAGSGVPGDPAVIREIRGVLASL